MAFTLLSLEKQKVKKAKPEQMFSSESMLPISEIRGDTLILKDGWLRAVLRVEGVNLDLKDGDEQMIIIERYKRFLNGLDFPIQILVRNTYLDLTPYIWYMQKNVSKIDNEALKDQWEKYISFLEQINVAQGLLFVKEFYIIVPLYESSYNEENQIKQWWLDKLLKALNAKDSAESIVWRYRTFLRIKSQLDTRCNLIIEWLGGIGMHVERLWTNDIISLLFQAYNPSLHKSQSEVVE
jgi:hypothetical protein